MNVRPIGINENVHIIPEQLTESLVIIERDYVKVRMGGCGCC